MKSFLQVIGTLLYSAAASCIVFWFHWWVTLLATTSINEWGTFLLFLFVAESALIGLIGIITGKSTPLAALAAYITGGNMAAEIVYIIIFAIAGLGACVLPFMFINMESTAVNWAAAVTQAINIAIIYTMFIASYFFNPNANRIRKIQSLINKDRTVTDAINIMDGWLVSSCVGMDCGVALLVITELKRFPKYYLYLTYKERTPTAEEIKNLHLALTDKDSIVSKAHKKNITVESYLAGYTDKYKNPDVRAALSLCIPYKRYMQYDDIYENHLMLKMLYGEDSKEANTYILEKCKLIKYPQEFLKYTQFRARNKSQLQIISDFLDLS